MLTQQQPNRAPKIPKYRTTPRAVFVFNIQVNFHKQQQHFIDFDTIGDFNTKTKFSKTIGK